MLNVEDVNAYVLGEHGDSQVPIWSSANIAGFPLDDFADQVKHKIDKEAVADRTKNGGAEVIGLKGATFYGIAMSVSNLVEAIIRDDSAILPVAHVLDEKFGEWAGVALSIPCRLGWEGIEKTLMIPMNDEEKSSYGSFRSDSEGLLESRLKISKKKKKGRTRKWIRKNLH